MVHKIPINLDEPTPFQLDKPDERASKAIKGKITRTAKRLARPITEAQIRHFEKYLHPVQVGPYECWVHTGKNIAKDKQGRGTYVRVRHNGVLVYAHRLAFVIGTGTTFEDIRDYQISHVNCCIGYRCCRPSHLFKGRKPKVGEGDRGNIGQRERDKLALKEEKTAHLVGSIPRVVTRTWLYPKFTTGQTTSVEGGVSREDRINRIVAEHERQWRDRDHSIASVAARPVMVDNTRQVAEGYARGFYN